MGMYQRALARLSTMGGLRWALSKVLSPLDTRLKGTRFAPSTLGVDFPLCFLTTTGRKSGAKRTVPLFFVTAPNGSPAVVATNFGQENHPAWALNLDAHPNATLEIDGLSRSVVARRASNDEASALWPLFDGFWPGYEEYRKLAPRDIRVFVLE
ncbi:MAG: nitroreductase family deazaflavin-dependent oxidoreductase [Actinomycetia bacterium]|nr:nitroreductase family deazaflavin-dependent oxidoreductase [Actinomycetes bacterium]